MQAIIMAAGLGRRLGELSGGRPKSFIEIKGRKLIEYNLDMLSKYNVSDITIVTGYKHKEFERLLGARQGIKFSFNPFYETTNVLTSFWFGQSNIWDDIIYMHADTICDPLIFEELLKEEGDVILPVDFKLCDEEAMKVKLINNRVIEINKSMDINEADGEFIGIAKISRNCLRNLKKITCEAVENREFNLYFEWALQKVIDRQMHAITAIPTKGRFWQEIDFIQDYTYASDSIPISLIEL